MMGKRKSPPGEGGLAVFGVGLESLHHRCRRAGGLSAHQCHAHAGAAAQAAVGRTALNMVSVIAAQASGFIAFASTGKFPA